MLTGILATLFSLLIVAGFIVVFIFLFRRTSGKVLDSTKYSYLKYSGIQGQAKLLNLQDTGKTLADTYKIMDAEIEITNLKPSVKTKTQATFLKNKIPVVGSSVDVKYDPDNPKIAMIVV